MGTFNNSKKSHAGRLIILIAGVLLFVAHQDQWFWTDRRLLFGFMPVGLAYHAVYSIAAAALWWAAAKFAWPDELERFAVADDATRPLPPKIGDEKDEDPA